MSLELAMLIRGSCHCANISFTLSWEPDPVEIPARACDCSFCTKHGGVWTSNPDSTLTVRVREPQRVTRYAFGTRTATFQRCEQCVAVALVACVIDDRLNAVLIVTAVDYIDD